MEEQTPEAGPGGFSRRDMLRRSALVGGALVWTAPAVQTIASPAFATEGSPVTEECPPGNALSEVTVLLNCGGTVYWVKYNPQSGSGSPTACGPNINVAESNGATPDATCDAAEQAIKDYIAANNLTVASDGCPSATLSNGNLCVGAGCTILAWTVHDGALGQNNHCAYKVGDGAIVFGPTANDVLNICTQGGSTCFSKNTPN